MARKLLMAAGGTGGHMFPAQALAETLRPEGWEIAMMTDARGKVHSGRIPADPILEVAASSISPRRPVKAMRGTLNLAKGVRQAKAFMREWKPDVVVGFGGYPAFPAMRAAQSLRLPTVLHEQNAVLGRVNRIFARKATHVVSGFEVLKRLPTGARWLALGNPIRRDILDAVPPQYTPPSKTINLLMVGGSLGARLLCETTPKALALLPGDLRARLNVVAQTREDSLEMAEGIYKAAGIKAHCAPFFTDIETHLSEAHYIIARAGASSVSEIAAMGKPSLLVPLAIAMDDHQSVNAQSLKDHGAADILPESRFTAEALKNILMERLNDSAHLTSMADAARRTAKPNATEALAAHVRDVAG